MRICIVIPVYNEEKIIFQNIKIILEYAKQISSEFKLVVDDGSKDNTRELLKKCHDEDPDSLTLLFHHGNKGYGTALRTGTKFAIDNGFEYVVFMDSDLTNHPKYLKDFYKKMLEDYDYIKASRYSPGGGVLGVPWQRRLISLWGNRVARLMFGLPLHDLTNGFRAVKTNILSNIELKENGFAVIVEELCLSKFLVNSYAEVSYVLTSRSKDGGQTHFNYNFRTYFTYLKYAIKSMSKHNPIAINQ